MELVIQTIAILAAVYLGYRMGRGEELRVDVRKMKAIVRSDEQEAELHDKLLKNIQKVK